MTKNVSHVSQRIICPKCGTRNLRKSLSPKNGAEYFCDRDHTYFGISELVNVWNFDVVDFYGLDGQTQLTPSETGIMHFWIKKSRNLNDYRSDMYVAFPLVEEKIISTKWFDGTGGYSCDEPVWSSEIAREESYDVVNRMLLGIEELEDGFDARDLPCPIFQTGMC